MDFIEKIASKFIEENYLGGIETIKVVINNVRDEINDIDNSYDKIKFLNLILKSNNDFYSDHLKECKNINDCRWNHSYEGISYYLSQELARMGVNLDNNTFTQEEKNEAESKLDAIINKLNEMKLGQ